MSNNRSNLWMLCFSSNDLKSLDCIRPQEIQLIKNEIELLNSSNTIILPSISSIAQSSIYSAEEVKVISSKKDDTLDIITKTVSGKNSIFGEGFKA